MNKKLLFNIGKWLYFGIFIVLELLIYTLYMCQDFGVQIDLDNTLIKYIGIVSVVVFSFTSTLIIYAKDLLNKDENKYSKRDALVTLFALIFTLIADSFLLLKNTYYEIGVSFFIITQLLYFFRLIVGTDFNMKRINSSTITRVSLFLIAVVSLLILNMFSILNLVVGFYFINLVMNLVDSIISTIKLRKDKRRFLTGLFFSIGLLLFIGCDVSLGLSHLLGILSQYIWLFYLPSQVIIVITSLSLYGLSYTKEEQYGI